MRLSRALSTVQILFSTTRTFLFMQPSFRWHKYHPLSAVVKRAALSEKRWQECDWNQDQSPRKQLHSADRWTLCTPPKFFLKPLCVELLDDYVGVLCCILFDTTTGGRQSRKMPFSTHNEICATCKWNALFPVACLSIYCINTLQMPVSRIAAL